MNDVKSLIQNGDFVVYEWKGEDCISLAIQRDNEIILVDYSDYFARLWRIQEEAIKKIFRYNSHSYGVKAGFDGNFDEEYGKIIYDSRKVLEVTMEELEEHFRRRVKIVRENE